MTSSQQKQLAKVVSEATKTLVGIEKHSMTPTLIQIAYDYERRREGGEFTEALTEVKLANVIKLAKAGKDPISDLKRYALTRKKENQVSDLENPNILRKEWNNFTDEAGPLFAQPSTEKTNSTKTMATPNIVKAASLADILGTNKKAQKPIPDKWKRHHAKLIEQRDVLQEQLQERNASFRDADYGSYAEAGDVASQILTQDSATAALKQTQLMLSETNFAIRRIENDTYGVCELTGKPIEPARLLANPQTRHSMEGDRLYQDVLRQQGQGGPERATDIFKAQETARVPSTDDDDEEVSIVKVETEDEDDVEKDVDEDIDDEEEDDVEEKDKDVSPDAYGIRPPDDDDDGELADPAEEGEAIEKEFKRKRRPDSPSL